jgi:hypothetical protein
MAVNTSYHADPVPSLEVQAEILSGLVPITADYAAVPIGEGFNWTEQFSHINSGQWYLVVFRSIRRADADVALLTEMDDRAYEEALNRPGLLYYFKGTANVVGECLSFCIWTGQAAAQHARDQPEHQAAMQLVAAMYESYQLERWLLRKQADGPLTQERLDSGAVHHLSSATDSPVAGGPAHIPHAGPVPGSR